MKKINKKDRKRLFIKIGLFFTLINIPNLATGTINLMDVKVIEEDAKIKIDIITDEPPLKYDSFTLDKPPSITIDLYNTQCSEKELDIGRNGINKISLIPQEGNKTRAVISLIKLLPYQIQKQKNGIEIIIDNPYHCYQLTAIDVKEDKSKISLLISSTSPPQYKYFDLSNPYRIIIDFLNAVNNIKDTKVTSKIIKNIIPSQRQVDPVKVARVIVELTEFMPYQVVSAENQVVLELTKYPTVRETLPEVKETPTTVKNIPPKIIEKEKPKIKEVREKPLMPKPPLPAISSIEEKKEPTLSLDFKNANLLDALRLIAHKTGMNILPGKNVTGVVTVKLDNVHWRKALDLILKSLGYAYIIDDNIIRVDDPTVLFGDTVTRIFKLKYANEAEMTAVVTNIMTTLSQQQARRMGGGGTPLPGTVIADKRTRSIVVTDIPYNVNQIEEMIKKLDSITPQVMIEAKIVEVTLDKRNMLGFEWEVLDKKPHSLKVGSHMEEGQPGEERGDLLYSRVTPGHELDLKIAALVSEGKANILSSPKILALDNEDAQIIVGADIPYQETTISEGKIQTTVNFRQVGVQLKVTPQITPDDFIVLNVTPEVSSLENWVQGMPVISTKRATSQLIVKDGETIVIGGMIDDQGTEKINKIPFFGDLPLLGPLFRKTISQNRKRELLIFITPYIKKYA